MRATETRSRMTMLHTGYSLNYQLMSSSSPVLSCVPSTVFMTVFWPSGICVLRCSQACCLTPSATPSPTPAITAFSECVTTPPSLVCYRTVSRHVRTALTAVFSKTVTTAPISGVFRGIKKYLSKSVSMVPCLPLTRALRPHPMLCVHQAYRATRPPSRTGDAKKTATQTLKRCCTVAVCSHTPIRLTTARIPAV